MLTAEQFPYKSILNMLANPITSYPTIGNATIGLRIVLLIEDNFLKKITAVFHTPNSR